MACMRGNTQAPRGTHLNACQSWKDSVMKRSHYGYDFMQKIISDNHNHFLGALKFNGFLSFISYNFMKFNPMVSRLLSH